MSEREPYDEARIARIRGVLAASVSKFGAVDNGNKALGDFVFVLDTAESEHAARLEAEARVERLESALGRVRMEAIVLRMTNAAGHTAAYDLRADISAALDELDAALETGGGG